MNPFNSLLFFLEFTVFMHLMNPPIIGNDYWELIEMTSNEFIRIAQKTGEAFNIINIIIENG